MAITIQNHYVSLVSVSGSFCTYSFYAEYSGNSDLANIQSRNFNYEFGTNTYTPDTTAASGIWYSSLSGNPSNIPIDVVMTWYPWLHVQGIGDYFGSTGNTKTAAMAGTASAPSVASITSSSASVSCNYVPNVSESTTSAQLQYKRTIDSTWTNFGSPKTDGTGYGTVAISSISLTGLTSSTSYDVRVVVTRTTANDTVITGSATSFNTLPGEPEITTDAASSVAATTAQLNATLVINAGTTVTVYWKWGTDNPPTQNTTASQSASADGTFSVGITGLVGTTAYFAQAFTEFATPSGSPNSGSVVTFTTPGDPLAAAANEDHMHIYEYDGKYGAVKTVYFTLQSPAATSSDRLVTTAPGTLFAAGDVKLSKDGGAFANATSSVAQIAASNPLYSLDLTATEMQCENLIVQIVDQNGPAFRDALIHVRTKLKLGQVDIDASNLTNTSAMVLTGVGTGHGLEAVGGATGNDIDGIVAQHFLRVSACQANATGTVVKLDSGASATNDYYNGALVTVVIGTGAGQARVITDYDGTSKEATVDTAWATIPTSGSTVILSAGDKVWDLSPATELASVPGSTGTYGTKVQFLFQRFAFKITQTATLQTWFKADSSTTLASRAVDDDGVTQLLAKLT